MAQFLGRVTRSQPTRYEEYNDDELILSLDRLNGTPPEVLDNAELMQMLLPVIRADFSLFSNYQYHQDFILDIPIITLNGTDDDHIERENVKNWSSLTSKKCKINWMAGDHFFIENNRSEFLEHLENELFLTGFLP